jgi:hypothetical protein
MTRIFGGYHSKGQGVRHERLGGILDGVWDLPLYLRQRVGGGVAVGTPTERSGARSHAVGMDAEAPNVYRCGRNDALRVASRTAQGIELTSDQRAFPKSWRNNCSALARPSSVTATDVALVLGLEMYPFS